MMLSERNIKLFRRDIKLSEQVNYFVRTRYYVERDMLSCSVETLCCPNEILSCSDEVLSCRNK